MNENHGTGHAPYGSMSAWQAYGPGFDHRNHKVSFKA